MNARTLNRYARQLRHHQQVFVTTPFSLDSASGFAAAVERVAHSMETESALYEDAPEPAEVLMDATLAALEPGWRIVDGERVYSSAFLNDRRR